MLLNLFKVLLQPSHPGTGNGAHTGPEPVAPHQMNIEHKDKCSFRHAEDKQPHTAEDGGCLAKASVTIHEPDKVVLTARPAKR